MDEDVLVLCTLVCWVSVIQIIHVMYDTYSRGHSLNEMAYKISISGFQAIISNYEYHGALEINLSISMKDFDDKLQARCM